MHGMLDYATGATLVAAPAALGLGGTPAGWILRGAGAGHAGYAALTRYELGVVKVLPYRAHLVLDAAAAVGLAASPWIFGTARRGPRHWLPHVLLGVYELGAVALSDPSGRGAGGADASDAGADGADDPTGRRVVPGAPQGVPGAGPAGPAAVKRTGSVDDDAPKLSHPSELKTVYPEGADAEERIRRGAVGDRSGGGGAGSGTGPASGEYRGG
jgi:hypothetical protein